MIENVLGVYVTEIFKVLLKILMGALLDKYKQEIKCYNRKLIQPWHIFQGSHLKAENVFYYGEP